MLYTGDFVLCYYVRFLQIRSQLNNETIQQANGLPLRLTSLQITY